jgi:TRAP-type C4-dicarboxylate transport system permease small subunit
MSNKIWQLIDQFNIAGALLSAAGVMVMTGLVVADVVLRRLFNSPLIFADEVAGYLLVLATILSVGYTLKGEGHIQVMILIQRLTHRKLAILRIFWCLISLVYVAFLVFMTGQLTLESYELKAFSPTPSQLPIAPFQLVMPVGCFLLFLQILGELIQAIFRLQSLDAINPPHEGEQS